jgi:low molecular weight protein-tyrosine phosphatase
MFADGANTKSAVLFVCMGNICRSPTAEGVLRALHLKMVPELKLRIDSAGTHAYYHLGEAPDRRSQQAAQQRGYDISGHRSRMVTPHDFNEFDYVLAMDRENLRHLQKMQPASSRARLGLLLDYSQSAKSSSVPDPYNCGPESFDRVLDLVEQGVLGLLRNLCESRDIRFPDELTAQQKARR